MEAVKSQRQEAPPIPSTRNRKKTTAEHIAIGPRDTRHRQRTSGAARAKRHRGVRQSREERLQVSQLRKARRRQSDTLISIPRENIQTRRRLRHFQEKKKKKQYSSLRGKTPNTYESVTCVSNSFSFSVMTSAQTAQGWEKGELASGALVLTEARGSLPCVLGPVSDTTEHVICAGTFDTANKHECL